MFELALVSHRDSAWRVRLENEHYCIMVGTLERHMISPIDEVRERYRKTGKLQGRVVFRFFPDWTLVVKTEACIPIVFGSLEQAKQALTEYYCH